MEKKMYVSPEMSVIEIRSENSLLLTSPYTLGIEDWQNGDVVIDF